MKQVFIMLLIILLANVSHGAERIHSVQETLLHEPVTVHEHSNHMTNQEMIPEEAIRLRILANSNRATDQHLKLRVRDAVYAYIHEKMMHVRDIEAARAELKRHLPVLQELVAQTIAANGVSETFTLQLAKHVPFPEKQYGDYVYPAGLYEALVITIGEGQGDNWWCVLFPPLCFVDFSKHEEAGTDATEKTDHDTNEVVNDETEEETEENEGASEEEKESVSEKEEETEVEVRFFLLDWFNLS